MKSNFLSYLLFQALIQTFYGRNEKTSAGFAIWHSARTLLSDSRTFFGLHLYLAGRCCKNFQRARGTAQCISGPGTTCLVSVTIYCTIFHDGSPPHRQFLRTKYLKKKIARKMLIKQIIEFELRGPGPLGCTSTPITA